MSKIHRGNVIDNVALEWFGFRRVDKGDEDWLHPYLEPRNLRLYYDDQAFHFVVKNTSQGIGKMRTVEELVNGFKFVTGGYNLYDPQYRNI